MAYARTLAPRRCAQCELSRHVMVTMEPGPDGVAWWLCSKCYLDGLRPMNQFGDAKPEPKVVLVTQEFADAVSKHGWKVSDDPPVERPAKKKRKRG